MLQAGWSLVRVSKRALNSFKWPNPLNPHHCSRVYSAYNRNKYQEICGFHGSDYEECHLLGYKNPVRTSQETHYVSATEPSQLILCKIWGIRGGGYEEWRLLGHKNPVHTSQKTYYVSATEHSRLMLYEIWGFHGGDYEERRRLTTQPTSVGRLSRQCGILNIPHPYRPPLSLTSIDFMLLFIWASLFSPPTVFLTQKLRTRPLCGL
jgi:hypothetical protein